MLKKHHVEAMLTADDRFVGSHSLDPAARKAQRLRTHSLTEARSFLDLVEQLKGRSFVQALRTAFGDPAAVRHLRMPIAARLRRFAGNDKRPGRNAAGQRSPGQGPHTSKG